MSTLGKSNKKGEKPNCDYSQKVKKEKKTNKLTFFKRDRAKKHSIQSWDFCTIKTSTQTLIHSRRQRLLYACAYCFLRTPHFLALTLTHALIHHRTHFWLVSPRGCKILSRKDIQPLRCGELKIARARGDNFADFCESANKVTTTLQGKSRLKRDFLVLCAIFLNYERNLLSYAFIKLK